MSYELAQVSRELKKVDLPIVIWGSGDLGRMAFKKLRQEGVSCEGFVVDDSAAGNADEKIYRKEELLGKFEEYVLVKGFASAYAMRDSDILSMWPGCRGVYTIVDVYEPDGIEEISEEYYAEHRDLFRKVRDSLADDFSKKSFDAFLDVKMHKKVDSIIPYVVKPQYFFRPAPWGGRKDDVLFNAGAYTGGTLLDFVKSRDGEYGGIISCEPDPDNYEKLLQTIREHGIKNVTAHQVGLYSEKATLRFSATGNEEAKIAASGEVELPVDSIDNLVGEGRVSIINMDIEGAELDALRGGKGTITRCRPILMVSAYHKRDDLFQIYNFLSDTLDGYRYYFRCHRPLAIDGVLYAAPEERVEGRDD